MKVSSIPRRCRVDILSTQPLRGLDGDSRSVAGKVRVLCGFTTASWLQCPCGTPPGSFTPVLPGQPSACAAWFVAYPGVSSNLADALHPSQAANDGIGAAVLAGVLRGFWIGRNYVSVVAQNPKRFSFPQKSEQFSTTGHFQKFFLNSSFILHPSSFRKAAG